MKKYIFTILLFSVFLNLKSQGLIFERDSFISCEKIDEKRGILYSAYSLEKYAPLPYSQNGSTCVAHAFSNASSIVLARKLGITNPSTKNLLLFSPYFIYYNNKDYNDNNCANGLSLDKVAKFVLNYGLCPISKVEYPIFYPFTKYKLCESLSYPSSHLDDRNLALEYKPDNIYRIENLTDIKTAISSDMPIVFGMAVPNSFINCVNTLWTPSSKDNIQNSYKHAVTIVGYDDYKFGGAVRIMNSWGDNWADNGFIWVKYTDLVKWSYGGYAIYKYSGNRGKEIKEGLNIEEINLTFKNDSISKILSEVIVKSNNDSTILNENKKDDIIKIQLPGQKKERKHNTSKFRRIYAILEENK